MPHLLYRRPAIPVGDCDAAAAFARARRALADAGAQRGVDEAEAAPGSAPRLRAALPRRRARRAAGSANRGRRTCERSQRCAARASSVEGCDEVVSFVQYVNEASRSEWQCSSGRSAESSSTSLQTQLRELADGGRQHALHDAIACAYQPRIVRRGDGHATQLIADTHAARHSGQQRTWRACSWGRGGIEQLDAVDGVSRSQPIWRRSAVGANACSPHRRLTDTDCSHSDGAGLAFASCAAAAVVCRRSPRRRGFRPPRSPASMLRRPTASSSSTATSRRMAARRSAKSSAWRKGGPAHTGAIRKNPCWNEFLAATHNLTATSIQPRLCIEAHSQIDSAIPSTTRLEQISALTEFCAARRAREDPAQPAAAAAARPLHLVLHLDGGGAAGQQSAEARLDL